MLRLAAPVRPSGSERDLSTWGDGLMAGGAGVRAQRVRICRGRLIFRRPGKVGCAALVNTRSGTRARSPDSYPTLPTSLDFGQDPGQHFPKLVRLRSPRAVAWCLRILRRMGLAHGGISTTMVRFLANFVGIKPQWVQIRPNLASFGRNRPNFVQIQDIVDQYRRSWLANLGFTLAINSEGSTRAG